jgi:hypothetical protein
LTTIIWINEPAILHLLISPPLRLRFIPANMAVYQATASAPVNIAVIKSVLTFTLGHAPYLLLRTCHSTNLCTGTGVNETRSSFCPQTRRCPSPLIRITCGRRPPLGPTRPSRRIGYGSTALKTRSRMEAVLPFALQK